MYDWILISCQEKCYHCLLWFGLPVRPMCYGLSCQPWILLGGDRTFKRWSLGGVSSVIGVVALNGILRLQPLLIFVCFLVAMR